MVDGIFAGRSSLYDNRYNVSLYGAQTAQGAPGLAAPVPQTAASAPRTASAPTIQSAPLDRADMLARLENDPAAMTVRSRIQYGETIPGRTAQAENPALENLPGAKSPQEVMEDSECQTCAERKYQDGSDDPGVSFKTAAHIDPDQAASVVRGHEQEHVVRERAKAEREDRKVVSQSVTLHTAICPECGRSYISGGTTRTTTKADLDAPPEQENAAEEAAVAA